MLRCYAVSGPDASYDFVTNNGRGFVMERALLVVALAVLALVVLTGAFSGGRYQIVAGVFKGGVRGVYRLDTQTGQTCFFKPAAPPGLNKAACSVP
jgi:hypothetical protein